LGSLLIFLFWKHKTKTEQENFNKRYIISLPLTPTIAQLVDIHL